VFELAIGLGFVLAQGCAAQVKLPFDLGDLVERARRIANLKRDSMAAAMGISGPQLSQQLTARGHLSLQRLLMMATQDDDGRKAFAALWLEIAEALELEDRDAVQAELRRLVDLVQTRMAKAELRDRARKETA